MSEGGADRLTWKHWALAAIPIALGLALAAVVAIPHYEREAQSSSGYCLQCHEEPSAGHAGLEAEGREAEGHGALACQRCHEAPEGGGIGALLPSALGGEVPAHGAIREPACAACHERQPRRWEALMQTPGHSAHAEEPALVPCAGCHGPSLHGAPEPREDCERCHERPPSHGDPEAELSCLVCHAFRPDPAPGSPEEEAQAEEDRQRRGGILPSQIHGNADCGGCHNPHTEEARGGPLADCARCHRGDLAEQIAGGPEGHRECLGCHQVHADREGEAVSCVACHLLPGSGPPGSSGEGVSPWAIRGTTLVSAARREQTRGWTHQGRCQSCHRPHTWGARLEDCGSCHEAQSASLEALPEGSHESCGGCHRPHAPPPTAEVCGSCHGAQAHTSPGLPPAHRDCLSCHDAHGGRPTAAGACTSCHEATPHALAGGPARHADCLSCHTPHGPPAAGAAASCQSCHREQHRALAGGRPPEAHQACTSCHQPHAFQAHAAEGRCATCHAAATAEGASHGGDCQSCHTPHGAPLGRAENCASCHAQIHPGVLPHQRCQSCHAPHRPEEAALGQCAGCHAQEARVSSSWPAGSPHAGACVSCHQAHDEDHPATCQSCHAAQATPAHRGDHPSCTSCHAPHQRPPAERAGGWWSGCASCHREEGRAVATATGTHGRCQGCHERPGAPLPSCTSCHARERLQLTHRVEEHGRCADCHTDHGAPLVERQRCLSCHRDRAGHFPDAPRCQSCHSFRSGHGAGPPG